MLAGQVSRLALQIGATAVLARLLTPADHGLLAMVVAITGFIGIFQDMGLSTATIQKDEINHDQVSTIFWLNVVFGVILALFTMLIAPLVVMFYNEPRLLWITIALSSSFVFGGLTSQHQALLGRNMKLGSITIIQLLSTASGYLVGIILACNGWGYWSLVAVQIIIPFSNAVGVWGASGWLPGLPTRGAGTRQMIKFGFNITGFSIVNYFTKHMDNILIGRFCGGTTLGLYSKAYQLMTLPLTNIKVPLTQVALPVLSSLQKDNIKFQKYYQNLILFIAFINMPLTVFLFVCAQNIIGLMLGAQWGGAVIIFKILAFFALIQPITSTTGIVLVSLGKTERYLKWGAFNSVFMILSFIAGLPWGAVGVASAYTVSNYCLLFPLLWYSFRGTPISIIQFLKILIRPFICSLITGIITFGIHDKLFENQSDILTIISCLLLVIVVYFLTWILPKNGREVLLWYFLNLKSLFVKVEK